jgi:hypothetical protein
VPLVPTGSGLGLVHDVRRGRLLLHDVDAVLAVSLVLVSLGAVRDNLVIVRSEPPAILTAVIFVDEERSHPLCFPFHRNICEIPLILLDFYCKLWVVPAVLIDTPARAGRGPATSRKGHLPFSPNRKATEVAKRAKKVFSAFSFPQSLFT